MKKNKLTYQNAGVNIAAGNAFVEKIKPVAAKTARPGVLTGIGSFGALFELPWERFQKPVLVSSTDGVGTKLKLAHKLNKHSSIGIDLVAMCANDVLVQGAEPLFFLDYFSSSYLDLNIASEVIHGIAEGCQLAGAALIGGETAEMPGMYQNEEYDLAGFCVGIVEKDHMITGERVKPGDILIGIASSGLHANGFSLVRYILDSKSISINIPFDGQTLGETLLLPTRIYVKSVLALLKHIKIHTLAHITGGGLLENIPRMLPPFTKACLDKTKWKIPSIFDWIQKTGNIDDHEMYRTFNCGIGMVVCVAQEDTAESMNLLTHLGETAWKIGRIESSDDHTPLVVI